MKRKLKYLISILVAVIVLSCVSEVAYVYAIDAGGSGGSDVGEKCKADATSSHSR